MRSPDDVPEDLARLDALRVLYEENQDHLLAFVRWRSTPALGGRRGPDDVLQLAFLRARKRWGSFERSGMAFRPWFCRIILDTLFDDHDYQGRMERDYRKETAYPDRSSVQFSMGIQNPATSASLALARKELREKIDRVLARLSPEHQEIMVLIHFSELTREQAADLLGIEAGTARQRYARARKRFRKIWIALYGLEAMES